MKKLTKKTRNLILLSVGVVMAGSLAFSAQPIYNSIVSNKKLAMPERATLDHNVEDAISSMNLGSHQVVGEIQRYDDNLAIDYTKVFKVQQDPVENHDEQTPTPKDEVDEDVVDEVEGMDEETYQESEEANVVSQSDNKISSTIIGIVTLVATIGLAALIARIIVKRHKKIKEEA